MSLLLHPSSVETTSSRRCALILDTALDRKRQLVFVTGSTGIGKTALVDALLEHAIAASALVARGACVEQYGTGEAFLPVLSALGALCRGKRGDHVVEILRRHAPTWLLQMPGLIADDDLAAVQARVQGATQARLLRELADALELLSAHRPIVIALDDLQWADNSTTELLALLGRRREPARLLVIGTCRHMELGKTDALKKVLGELTSHRQAATIALEPLAEAAVGEYLEARWARHRFPEVAHAIHDATGGNPMFMIALLDDIEARQMVRSIDSVWQLFASVDDIRAHRPDSVRQLIDIQIDRLDPAQQRMLEVASACGLNSPSAPWLARSISRSMRWKTAARGSPSKVGLFATRERRRGRTAHCKRDMRSFTISIEMPRACELRRPQRGSRIAA